MRRPLIVSIYQEGGRGVGGLFVSAYSFRISDRVLVHFVLEKKRRRR